MFFHFRVFSYCQLSNNHLPNTLPQWHSGLIKQKGNDYCGIVELIVPAISTGCFARLQEGSCNTAAPLTWSGARAHVNTDYIRQFHKYTSGYICVSDLSSLFALSDTSDATCSAYFQKWCYLCSPGERMMHNSTISLWLENNHLPTAFMLIKRTIIDLYLQSDTLKKNLSTQLFLY